MEQVVDAVKLLRMIIGIVRVEKMICILRGSIPIVRNDLESRCTKICSARKENIKLEFIPILVSYYCDIINEKEVIKVGHGLSVIIQCVRYLIMVEDIRQYLCMRTRTIEDTYQAKA